jgi:hypothetical protein
MKLWKVVIVVAQCDTEGKREIHREKKVRIFDVFELATMFARIGDEGYSPWKAIVDRKIWEYDVSSVKQLVEKQREIVTEATRIETYWEAAE